MTPLNYPLLLFAIQSNPMENIRQLQCKQTVCYSAALIRQYKIPSFFLLPYDMQIGLETM